MSTATTICLWYDTEAEQAARYYCSVIDGAELGPISYYPAGSYGGRDGQVMGAEFTIGGVHFYGLNGGPEFKFDEAVSIQLRVDTQEEIDRYWDALLADGGQPSQCGWLRDRWGLAWQVTGRRMEELFRDAPPDVAARVNAALMDMVKIDLAALERAAQGEQA